MSLFDFLPSTISSSFTKSSSTTTTESISHPFLLPFLPIPLSLSSLFFFIFLPLFLYACIDLFSLLFPFIKLSLRSLYFSFISPPTPCYLINYSVFTPPSSWAVSLERLHDIAKNQFKMTDSAIEFCRKIMENSGVGPEAAFPPAIQGPPLSGPDGGPSVETARLENEFIYKSMINNLLKKLNWTKKDLRNNIDILIVNSSLFNPTPSLASSIIHYYQLKPSIEAYNLGGMGCSASLLAIRLASQLLSLSKLHKKRSMALIISNENITQNTYRGDDRTMLVQNAIFRCGGAAMLLANYKYKNKNTKNNNSNNDSNNNNDNNNTNNNTNNTNNNNKDGTTPAPSIDSDDSDLHPYGTYSSMPDSPFLSPSSRLPPLPLLQLEFTSRYHMGANSDAYQCVWQQNDAMGNLGIKLSKQLMKIAGVSLTKSIESIVWKLLPIDELIRYGIVFGGSILTKFIQKHVWNKCRVIGTPKPRWNKGIDYFCVHAGGRAVLDGVADGLGLTESEMRASRETLYRLGNVSSASCWYEIDWLVQTGRLRKKGERVWQITFGAGFKCNHAVWKVVG